MTVYAKFRRLGLDTGPVGLYLTDEETSPYDCTPVGARVFGDAGVDGIHFCRIPDCGDMVFAVSPMNGPDDCVHPIAGSFEDFLRLLLSCGDTAALEQAHQWERSRFDRFVAENPPSPEGRAVLDTLAAALELTPMPELWEYLHRLENTFDFSRLRFNQAHREAMAAVREVPADDGWAVRFGDTLHCRSHRGGKRAGEEVTLGRVFRWGGEEWHIPSLYVCGGGLVMDFCARTDAGALRAFLDKWLPRLRKAGLDPEEETAVHRENPMTAEFVPGLTLNGRELRWNHGSSTIWSPLLAEAEEDAMDKAARQAVEHYGLDPAENWHIHRYSFPWATARKPALNTLTLTMAAEETELPALRFTAEAGDELPFTHPVTGQRHTLTVTALTPREFTPTQRISEEYDHPGHFAVLEYTVAPELEKNECFLRDCAPGDQPRRRQDFAGPTRQGGSSAAVFGIIGGADGPTAVVVGVPGGTAPLPRAACSSLYFAPPERVEWQLTIRAKLLEDHTEPLL